MLKKIAGFVLPKMPTSTATGASAGAGAATGAGLTAGVVGGLSVAGSAAALMIGPLINTYVKDENGMGFLDRQVRDNNNYQFQQQINGWSRNGGELETHYFI